MLPLNHPKSAFHVSGNRQLETYPLVLGISLFSVSPFLSHMVGALASWFTLRGHLSLLDATVGMASHLVPLVEWRAHWDKKDAFESTSDSQYPHYTAYRLKMDTGMSRSLPQTHLLATFSGTGKIWKSSLTSIQIRGPRKLTS